MHISGRKVYMSLICVNHHNTIVTVQYHDIYVPSPIPYRTSMLALVLLSTILHVAILHSIEEFSYDCVEEIFFLMWSLDTLPVYIMYTFSYFPNYRLNCRLSILKATCRLCKNIIYCGNYY